MVKRTVLAACFVILAVVSTASSQSWRQNQLTFSGPVALPGVTLAAGSYMFEIGPPGVNLDVVRVTTRTGHVVYTAFTRIVDRPAGMAPNVAITFGEARTGAPQPIRAWFPLGEPTGREFIYQ